MAREQVGQLARAERPRRSRRRSTISRLERVEIVARGDGDERGEEARARASDARPRTCFPAQTSPRAGSSSFVAPDEVHRRDPLRTNGRPRLARRTSSAPPAARQSDGSTTSSFGKTSATPTRSTHAAASSTVVTTSRFRRTFVTRPSRCLAPGMAEAAVVICRRCHSVIASVEFVHGAWHRPRPAEQGRSGRRVHNANHGANPARRHRRHRRVQGVRADAAARQGRATTSSRSSPRAARRFVGEETFVALARRPPAEDVYPHLTRADLLVVAPCTANTLAKLAHGLADNVLTEAALAHRGRDPPRAGDEPAHVGGSRDARERCDAARTRGRDRRARTRARWPRASGVSGRMAEPAEIAARVAQLLAPPSLAGRRVLVTAGGTREPVDSVRFVGNRSSGRMGVALAEEARRRGAEVVLLAANLAVPAPAGRRGDPDADGRVDARRRARAHRRRRRAARGRRRRLPAGGRARGEAREDGRAVVARARADGGHRPRLWASGSGRARCSSRSAPSTARRVWSGSARCSTRRTPTWSSTTTSRGRHRLRQPRERGRDRVARGRPPRFEDVEGRDRRGDPRRGRAAPRLTVTTSSASRPARQQSRRCANSCLLETIRQRHSRTVPHHSSGQATKGLEQSGR